jgi:antitoxin component HigA of HigAB toxin-antitoxin module
VKAAPRCVPAKKSVCACKPKSLGYNRGMKDVEQVLRRAIDKSGLDGAELARRAGLTKGSLSLFINHKRGLTLRSVNKLAAVLGLELAKKRGR